MDTANAAHRITRALRSIHWRNLILEAALVWGTLFVYQIGRFLARPDPAVAHANALSLMRWESVLFLDFEVGFQHWTMQREWLLLFFNDYYSHMHFVPTMLFLLWLYLKNRHRYQLVRTMLLAATLLGFFVHWLLPTAPPRLVPESGMVDTLALYDNPMSYDNSGMARLANQYAAVPSFHFGWALFLAVAVILLSTWRWRWLILAHPILMTLCITATGNHFILDAAAALVLEGAVAVGLLAARHRFGWFTPRPTAEVPVAGRARVPGPLSPHPVPSPQPAPEAADEPAT